MKIIHAVCITALLAIFTWMPVRAYDMSTINSTITVRSLNYPHIQPYTPWQTWARSLLNLNGGSAFDFRRGEIGGGISQETAIPPVIPFMWRQRDWFVITAGMAAFQTRRVGFVGAKVKIVPLLDKLAPAHPATIALDNRFIRLDISAFVGTNFDRFDPAYGLMVDVLKKEFLK